MSESDKGKLELVEELAKNAQRLLGDGQAAEALPLAIQALHLLEGLEGEAARRLRAGCLAIRGTAFLHLQQHDNALSDLTKAIELTPNNAAAYANRATIYLSLKQHDKALRDLNKALEVDPNNAGAYNNRGNVYRDLKQYDKALSDLNKSIEMNPQDAVAYNNRGNVYIDMQRYDEALQDFTKAIELSPSYAAAYNNRGNVYSNMGRYDEALRDYKKAIELDPREPDHYHNRALVIAQKAYSEVLSGEGLVKKLEEREKEYRKRLDEIEKTIQKRRWRLFAFLLYGSMMIASMVIVVFGTNFGVGVFGINFGAGENGMGFPYILVWASFFFTLLLSGLSYPFINGLREAQRDKRHLEIAIEDYFRKYVLLRHVQVALPEQKPALIAATHEHFVTRSAAEFLAETPMHKESYGMWERPLQALRKQKDDIKHTTAPRS